MLNFTAECDYVLETKNINRLILGGWTGRDADAVETHIVELEELGVARPKSVPTFFRMSRDRITTGKVIEVSGPDTSGEVEFVIVNSPKNGLFLGVGSDHTDRKLETVSVCQSKQICEKVIAPVFGISKKFTVTGIVWFCGLLSMKMANASPTKKVQSTVCFMSIHCWQITKYIQGPVLGCQIW